MNAYKGTPDEADGEEFRCDRWYTGVWGGGGEEDDAMKVKATQYNLTDTKTDRIKSTDNVKVVYKIENRFFSG